MKEHIMWEYEGKPFLPDEFIHDHQGFVYCITNLQNQRKYIGKKNFWKTVKRPPLKGKKKRRISIEESDWRTYVGSNDELNEIVKENTGSAVLLKKEILHLAPTKGIMSYLETYEQIKNGVILSDEYYNGIVSCRINSKHIPEKFREYVKQRISERRP